MLKKHPLWAHMQQLLSSDRKKQKVGIVKPRNLPKTIDKSAELHYHRLGPAILVTFKGPTELREKMRRTVSLELKSGLQFDRRFIENKAFFEIEPKTPKKKANELKMAEYEAAYAKDKKMFEIAAAGTKETRNRARIRLQAEGRSRANEG